MKPFNLGDLAIWMNGQLIGDPKIEVTGFKTDSRDVKPGELFFAIKGERVDGHDYITRAIELGARAAVVDHKQEISDLPQIIVDDTVLAIGDMAREFRKHFSPKVIGITGSVGKTSVKEMLAVILQTSYTVLYNEGNKNTEIGLPLTLMNLNSGHNAVVVEMGMRGLGQIKYLAEIAQPQYGLITNIGVSHIELLGSREGISDAKGELLEALPEEGTAVLPCDDYFFPRLKSKYNGKIITFGKNPNADVRLLRAKITSDGKTVTMISIHGRQYTFTLPLPGEHHALNATAAIAGALIFNIHPQKAVEALANVTLPGMRTEIIQGDGYKILLDAYNANPQSMMAGLETLQSMGQGSKLIAILGDMKELGDYTDTGHREVGKYAAEIKPDWIVTVGELAKQIAQTAIEHSYPSAQTVSLTNNVEAVDFLKKQDLSGALLLIKGSRSMEMEQIANALTGKLNEGGHR